MATPTPGSASRPGQSGAPQGGPRPAGRGITMLGAQQTGKTTFLGALQLALLRRPALGWSLVGENEASAQALVEFVDAMTDEHIFPKPTTDIADYKWALEAELPGAIKEWHWWGFRRRDQYVSIPLDLVDAPGESADSRQMYGRASSRLLIENLARSAGIVLFFDPISEFGRGDAFRHMYGVLTQLRTLLQHRGRLPHYVAVCITKFDEIPVFEAAQKLRVVEYDPYPPEFPAVPDQYAREFFTRLVRVSKSDSAGLMLPMLEQTFRPERIKFFVTSAIGFYVDAQLEVFDPEDYQNHIPREHPGGLDYIRGGIYPINVVEPVLWLSRNVAEAAR
jgi:hypothetical protein